MPEPARTPHIRELVAEGRDILDLSAGEPDFGTPAFISEAAIESKSDSRTRRHDLRPDLPVDNVLSDPRILARLRPVQRVPDELFLVLVDTRVIALRVLPVKVLPAGRVAVHVDELSHRALLVVQVDLALRLAVIHEHPRRQLALAVHRQRVLEHAHLARAVRG